MTLYIGHRIRKACTILRKTTPFKEALPYLSFLRDNGRYNFGNLERVEKAAIDQRGGEYITTQNGSTLFPTKNYFS